MATVSASIDSQRRKEAARALLNIAMLEGMLLFAVVSIYLYTKEMTYLVGGVVATSLIFVPILLRWMRDHAPAMKSSAAADQQ
ncbi:MAG: hypothetical protein RIA10_15315 [Amphiplicatus sp.]